MRSEAPRQGSAVLLFIFMAISLSAQSPAAAEGVAHVDSAKAAPDTTRERTWALGVSVGLPQIIAFTAERRVIPYLHAQGNIGSLLLFNSLNARGLFMPEGQDFYPYLFAGGGYFFTLFGLDSADDSAFYSWLGGGLRLRIKRLLLFAEVSSVKELDDDATELSTFGSAGGILFKF